MNLRKLLKFYPGSMYNSCIIILSLATFSLPFVIYISELKSGSTFNEYADWHSSMIFTGSVPFLFILPCSFLFSLFSLFQKKTCLTIPQFSITSAFQIFLFLIYLNYLGNCLD